MYSTTWNRASQLRGSATLGDAAVLDATAVGDPDIPPTATVAGSSRNGSTARLERVGLEHGIGIDERAQGRLTRH